MSWIKAAFLTGLLSSLLINATPQAMAADGDHRGGRGCQRGDRIDIQDLDMSPDPSYRGPAGSRLEGTHQFRARARMRNRCCGPRG